MLRSTSTGDDPAAFERAVCDAFALMGFITTHIGGNGKPDGTLDAPLGPLGYRAILECKTAQSGVAKTVAPSEPAKFREPYGATAAVIVAPDIKREATFLAELQTHDIALWMVDDLIEALRNDVDPYECRELFKAGPVHDRLHDLIWNRTHGPEKRAQVIRTLLQRDGFAAQRDLVGRVPWSEMPAITLDIAMVVVEGASASPASPAAHRARRFARRWTTWCTRSTPSRCPSTTASSSAARAAQSNAAVRAR